MRLQRYGYGPLAQRGLSLAVLMIGLDQLTKTWVVSSLKIVGTSVKILPFFALTLVHNIGISYGLLSFGGMMRWVLAVFQFGVAIWLIRMIRQVQTPLMAAAFGLIIGGAIGNGIDRVRLGYVVDFADFGRIFPWVFNVADSAITIGVLAFLVDTFVVRRDQGLDV